MVVILRRHLEPLSITGYAWRAFREDETPLYMGEITLCLLKERVIEAFGHVLRAGGTIDFKEKS